LLILVHWAMIEKTSFIPKNVLYKLFDEMVR